MFKMIVNKTKEKACLLPIVLCAFFLFASNAHGSVTEQSDRQISKTTSDALNIIQKLDDEIYYGPSVSELILNCSYMQDAYYAYLLQAENIHEYHYGMELLDGHMDSFKSICTYLSDVFNFYRGTGDPSTPEVVPTEFYGKETNGFLNTFKLEGPLTAEERELYFDQEYSRYMQDYTEVPFILNVSTLDNLEPGTLYNFVLLPDGTINVALERPGEREYHERDKVVVEKFNYPNHTILAGNAHQIVITAGAFVMHKEADKRLFFVSCKSGHYQPSYTSLNWMRTQLSHLGINPYTVICVNDVDLSQSVLKTYNGAKIPLFISTHDNQRLHDIAQTRWNETYQQIDRSLFARLAQGDFSMINAELIALFKQQRSEATYMRSAYRLFSAEHTAPAAFNEFVRRFGKLKDAMKHFAWKQLNYTEIQNQAANLINLMDNYEQEIVSYEFTPADTASFHEFLTGNIAHMHYLMDCENLSKEEFHDLKKLSRELCALFLNLRTDFRLKSKGYFIYNTAADAFFQINDLMAKSDTIFASKEPGNVRVIVPRKIAERLRQNLNHLGIAPPQFCLEFDEKAAANMINSAKQGIYTSSHWTRVALQEIFEKNQPLNPVDFSTILQKLKILLRDAEYAGNTVRFIDVRHSLPEQYLKMMIQIRYMIVLAEQQNSEVFLQEIKNTTDLLYYEPSKILQNYILTDRDSFSSTLNTCLSSLNVVSGAEVNNISRGQANKVAENVQAFRDLMNLFRKNGLIRKVEPGTTPLPMTCYENLEEHCDVLLNGLKDSNDVFVTPAMKLSAEIILYRMSAAPQNI